MLEELIVAGLFNLLIYVIVVYTIMIIVHETGHFLAALCYGVKYKEISWKVIGMQYPRNRLSLNQRNGVLAAGIFAGIIPIFLLGKFPEFLILLVFAFYIYGCMKDIKKIYKYTNRGNSENNQG